MKKAVLGARLLMGLMLLVFGLNGFFGFLPDPEPTPEGGAFIDALIDSGYLWSLKSAIEIACGVFLLTGLFTPLGLVLFAPILVNIVAFHFYPDVPANGGPAFLLLFLELFLAWAYAPSFRGVLSIGGRTRFAD